MELSVSNIAWTADLESTCFDVLIKNQITNLEIAPTKYWPDLERVQLQEVSNKKNEVLNRGISIVAAQSLLFGRPDLFIFGDDNNVEKTLAYLSKVIDICSSLGCKDLVFGSPKNRLKGSRTFTEAFKESAVFFEKAAEISGARGINFCLEPNASQYGCDFVTNVSEAIQVIDFVNHPNFGLNLDIGNMLMSQENVEETIDRTLEYAKHVHISAPNLAPVRNLADMVGPNIWRLLKKFPHCLSIEMLIPSNTDIVPELDRNLQFICENLEIH